MIKKLKTVIVLLIQLLFLQIASGQNQTDMAAYLRQRFQNFCRNVPREEIYIHTDRNEYVSGEDMWFKVYLLDRQSGKPSLDSRIVYFEILNNENRPVVQKRILTDRGFGPGQVTLPDTLSTGTYTVRAYTSWMKNFLPENCFTNEITVFNSLKSISFKGIKKPLPAKIKSDPAMSSGITLGIVNSKPQTLGLEVNTSDKFRSDNNNQIYIFIQTHGNINHVSGEKLTGSNTLIEIPRGELDNGINQITIFNSKAEAVTGKYIYTPEIRNNLITIHAADSCGLRDKISLEIQSTSRITSLKTMSISVAPLAADRAVTDIADYMILGSEFGINPMQVLKGRNISEHAAVIDSLLQNLKSNWIDWSIILSDKSPKIRYQPEKEDHFLTGRLINVDSQNAGAGSYLLMSEPGKQAVFQYARTDNDGNFSFRLHIDGDMKDLIIMPDDVTKNHKIVIEPSFSDKYQKIDIKNDTAGGALIKAVSKLSINHQVQKIYGISTPGRQLNLPLKSVKPVRFYGKPDIELIMADYIKLPVMSEVFFELLPGVSLKKKRSGAEISITYRIEDEQFTTNPTLMIDGVIITDPTLIANLDPDLVEKIDVIREKYQVGKYYFPGLVNVITRTGNFNSVSLPDYMIRLPYKVIDPVLSFVSPDYSSDSLKESRIPDYRNTLYWNPSVQPDANGRAKLEFWSSDNKADYLIDIQGITSDGKLFSSRKRVSVK